MNAASRTFRCAAFTAPLRNHDARAAEPRPVPRERRHKGQLNEQRLAAVNAASRTFRCAAFTAPLRDHDARAAEPRPRRASGATRVN